VGRKLLYRRNDLELLVFGLNQKYKTKEGQLGQGRKARSQQEELRKIFMD